MEFAYPAAFAGLAAIPLLFLLNLWKYRRLRVRVSSFTIWQRMSQHVEAPPSSTQRYFNISLFAQILVVVLLTLAVAGPRARHSFQAHRIVHMLIDRSASTEADSKGSRVFDRMTLAASTLLRYLSEADRVYCHTAPGLSGIDSVGPMVPEEAQEWLSSIDPLELPCSFSDAAVTVAARVAPERSQLFVFTDADIHGAPNSVHVTVIPADAGNVAITAAKAKLHDKELRLFFRVANFSKEARTVKWAVVGASGLEHVSSGEPGLHLRPGSSSGISLTLPEKAKSEDVIEIRLLESDAFANDNHAFVTHNPGVRLNISYVGHQNRDLIRALSALPGAMVTVAETPGPESDLSVFNESSPRELPSCSTVIIAPPDGIPSLLASNSRDSYEPSGSLTTDPDASFMPDPGWTSRLTIHEALKPVLLKRTGTSTLLANGETPLIVNFALEGRSIVYVGFRLVDTNWPSQVSFPLFWGLLAERLGISRDEWATWRTGDTIPLPARNLKNIVAPQGETLVQAQSWPRIVFRPELTGIYRAAYAEEQKLFGVSLLSEEESRLSESHVPFNPNWLKPPQTREHITASEWLWPYFAFAAAIGMLVSWLLWRERKKD
jgi:hypothetical protein